MSTEKSDVSFKFVTVNILCDRLERGEITEGAFIRFCEFYEEQVAFLAKQPRSVENGVTYINAYLYLVCFGFSLPGSRRLLVA